MSKVIHPRVGLASLNLLWAVPLAFAIGYLPASIVRFDRCGIDECLGEVMGFASPSAPTALGVAALATFGALGLVPWLRPARLRLVIAFVAAVLVFVLYVWLILFNR